MDFETLYRSYAHDVRRFAYGLTGNAADADDIAATTFARAWSSNRAIKATTARGYLFAIARNLWRDQRRTLRTTTHEVDGLADPADPESVAIGQERSDAVMRAIDALAPGDREALLLRAGGLGYAEIAHVLSISITAAKARVFRARQKLKETT